MNFVRIAASARPGRWASTTADGRPARSDVRCLLETIGQELLVDMLVEAYVDWREACARVNDTYSDWISGTVLGYRLACARYVAALDAEQHAADVYAGLVRRLRKLTSSDERQAGETGLAMRRRASS
jgi:hypothetical protein